MIFTYYMLYPAIEEDSKKIETLYITQHIFVIIIKTLYMFYMIYVHTNIYDTKIDPLAIIYISTKRNQS